MAGANELTILIDANTSGLQQGLQQAENQVRSFQDRIQGIADIGQKLAGLGAVMTAGLTVPIIGLGKSALQSYGEIQSLQKGLEAVMGSASLASAEFNKLKEVAKLPGLGMKEAVQGSINLQAIGINADKSRDILQQFGNAVATVGKGRVEFERAIYGVQQLANTDFPLGEDLNIIKDALPQVSNLLKEAFGSSRSDELANMGVSSKQVLDVILTGLGKLPRVSGGIKGAFENLSDAMQTSLGRIGKVIDDNLNISGLIDKITSAVDSVITAFEGLNPTLQKIILAVGGVLAVAGPLLLAVSGFMVALPTLKLGVTALGDVFASLVSPIGLVTLAIGALIVAVVANWDKIRPYIEKTIDQFKRLYNESFILRTGINAIVGIFQTLWYTVKNLTIGIYEQFKDVGKFVLNVLSSIGDALEGVFTLDASKIKASIQNFFSASATFAKDSKNNLINTFSNIGNELTSAIGKTASFRFDTSKATNLSFGEKEIAEKVKTNTKSLTKLKNETQKQLSEIYPTGSIAELRQRAELLIKAIETSNNDIVKIRGLDNFGNDKTKQGLPIYTGEIIAREEAYKRLEQINAQIDLLEPPKLKEIDSSALVRFRDNFSIQSTSLNLELTNGFTETERLINKASSGIKTEYLKLDGISDLLQKYYPKNSIEWYQAEIEKLNKLKEQAEVGTEAWRKLNDEIDKYNAKLGGKKQDGLTGIGNALREESNLISNETFNISNNLTNFANNTTDIFNKVKESLKKASLAESYKNLLASLSQIASENAVNAISDVFTSLGTAISNGTSVIDVVGKSLLGSFGKLLSEFGKQLIQYGIGMIVVKKAIQNPYLAIAAGAALVALGAGLTASVNKTVENSGIGGSGGVSSSTGSSASTNYSSSYSNTNTGSGGDVVFRISGPDLIGAINRNVVSADRLNSN